MQWLRWQFRTLWVRWLAVFAAGVLIGAAAMSWQGSSWVESTCPVCERPIIGHGDVVVIHASCRAVEAKSQAEAIVADTLHDGSAAEQEAEEWRSRQVTNSGSMVGVEP